MGLQYLQRSGLLGVTLSEIPYEDKSVLRNLMELYLHDHSEFDGADVDVHGLFGYRYIDHYWTEEGRYPFLIRVAGHIAGFVLVRRLSDELEAAKHSIAEFFVMRKYRQQGVGRQAAHRVFDLFPGDWHVGQGADNQGGQAFWRQVIGEYTGGEYTEGIEAEWNRPCQTFRTPIR